MMNRALTVIALVGGLSAVAAAPVGPSLQPSVPTQPPRVLTPPAHTISSVALASDGFFVTVASTAAEIASIQLQVGSAKVPVQTKAQGIVIIHVADPAAASVCNLGTIGFSLEGAKADTKVRHVQPTKAPAFTAGGPGLIGPAGDATGRLAFTAGGPTHWYGCGQKFEFSAAVTNDTDIAPQHLMMELLDVDGTKLGEQPVTVAAHGKASLLMGSNGTMVGRTGMLRARLVDATKELSGKLINGRDLGFTITREGPLPLKLID
jgi:hypothetical protein